LKRATTTTKTKVAKVRAELKTCSTADIKHIRYATMLMLLEWQSENFIWTMQCEADE